MPTTAATSTKSSWCNLPHQITQFFRVDHRVDPGDPTLRTNVKYQAGSEPAPASEKQRRLMVDLRHPDRTPPQIVLKHVVQHRGDILVARAGFPVDRYLSTAICKKGHILHQQVL